MKRRLALLTLLLLVATVACRRQEAATKEAAAAEPHPESFSNWTTRTELFAEYPPLVKGKTSRFAIHLTRLDNFKPVTQGRVEVRLERDAKKEVFSADAPSQPGIFGVAVTPTASGDYRLSIHLMSPALTDAHDLGAISTADTTQAAIHEHGPETQETITFLKEQQWTLDFGTAVVEDRELKSSLRVPGEVIPRSGGEADVSAPLDGRIVGNRVPVIGSRVRAGETLLRILPPTSLPGDVASLELALEEAEAEFSYARNDRERAERLVSAGASPAKRLEEARTAEVTSAARVKAAKARVAQYNATSAGTGTPENSTLFAVRAPISGVITETSTAPGANVKAGETLLRVVDVDTVYISAIVPEAALPRVKALSGAEMEIAGTEKPRRLQRLISVGRVVDTASRTFPVIYELDNRDRAVAVNQAVHVRLLTTKSSLAPAVPESAVVDDGGRPIVFVQLTGEAFVRRPVKLGVREGGMVEALQGVMPGERVVTKGAHLIRLASLSSQVPAHGHVH